jgi:alpha-ketoglutarate-dependent taurine dioxygenase
MSWHVEKLTGFIAARLTGLDLSKPHGPDTGTHLRRLLGEHQVLIIPGQRINLDHQKALTRLFGEPMSLPYVKPLEDDPEVIRVYKGADERGGVFGGDWHSDFSFLERPPGWFSSRRKHSATIWRRHHMGKSGCRLGLSCQTASAASAWPGRGSCRQTVWHQVGTAQAGPVRRGRSDVAWRPHGG